MLARIMIYTCDPLVAVGDISGNGASPLLFNLYFDFHLPILLPSITKVSTYLPNRVKEEPPLGLAGYRK